MKHHIGYGFLSYFNKNNKGTKDDKPLKGYSESTFEVSDPSSMAFIDHEKLQYDTHQYFWELDSVIARAKSAT